MGEANIKTISVFYIFIAMYATDLYSVRPRDRVYQIIVSSVIHSIATLHTLSSLIQLFSAIGIVYSVKVIGKVIVNESHTVCPVRSKRRPLSI
jgi:hypothetical protein